MKHDRRLVIRLLSVFLLGLLSIALPVSGQQAAKGQQASPFELGYKPRHPGTRWTLVYGSYDGVERFAVNELQRMSQIFFPYVIQVNSAKSTPPSDSYLLLVGTAANNAQIAELGRKNLIKLPVKREGYTIACLKSPINPELRIAVVAGADPNGVLYGVVEFNRRLADTTAESPAGRRQTFDQMAYFEVSEAPVIEDRGLWTWGYVTYDYRGYMDNMARLKMNKLIIANDTPSLNCREIIEYAHSRGIKVFLAFAWGWGIPNLDPNNKEHQRLIKEDVLANYEANYSHLGLDGIYFQSFTEHSNTRIGQKTTATLVCEWVNDIAGELLKRHPGLRIEFGVHATSILDNYQDFKALDSRIPIMWEDAGTMPYGRSTSSGSFPQVTLPEGRGPRSLATLEGTIDYSKRLATFRPDNKEFAMVAKGFMLLRWSTEFEHHGPFIMGERHPDFLQNRLRERQPRWDYANTRWAKEYPHAMRFFQELRSVCTGPMTVVALVEDGLFEKKIQLSVAIMGEMLWNPNRDEREIISRAMSSYYQ